MTNASTAAHAAIRDLQGTLAAPIRDLLTLEDYAACLDCEAVEAYEAVERIARGMAADLAAGAPVRPLSEYAGHTYADVLRRAEGHPAVDLLAWAPDGGAYT